MSFGITKTLPADEGMERVDSLYEGNVKEYESHMVSKLS